MIPSRYPFPVTQPERPVSGMAAENGIKSGCQCRQFCAKLQGIGLRQRVQLSVVTGTAQIEGSVR